MRRGPSPTKSDSRSTGGKRPERQERPGSRPASRPSSHPSGGKGKGFAGDRDRDRDREQGRKWSRPERKPEVVETPPEQIEGRHPVIEALKSGREINKILVGDGVEGGSSTEILARAREKGIVVQRVPRTKLESIAQTRNHQGVIAYIAAKDYVDLEDIIAAALKSDRPGLILVLDEIEDPHNLGSIMRSADGVGAHGIVIPKRRAVPLTATVSKASAGAIEHIPVARVGNLSHALMELKKQGFWVIGTDVDAEPLYHQVDMTGPTVLVIGNEGKGLGEVLKKRCDHLVRLPMIGEVSSLNAGVATGILLYEALRQRSGRS